MGRGRKSKAQNMVTIDRQSSRVSEKAQNDLIQHMEEKIRRETQQKKLEMQIVKNSSIKSYPDKIMMNDGVIYNGVQNLSQFTVNQFADALPFMSMIDMSSNLKLNAEVMLQKFALNVDEEHPKHRIYMRDEQNCQQFAILQRCVELMYLPEPLEDLQGWILHVGTIFVFGGVHFSLEDAVNRVKVMIHHLMTEQATLSVSSHE